MLERTHSRSKKEYWNGDIPWINSGEVNHFRIISPSEYITKMGLEKSATKLLPKKTTVIAITGATLGQVSLLEIDSCANQSVVGILPNNYLSYEFVYPFIKSNIDELISHQTGGTQQHINKQNIEGLEIYVPDEETMKNYCNIIAALYALIASNCFKINILTNLRDILLSKLMSDEIDVSNIDI
ncbi:MAG: restriction endonuclease subunit S [Erysipelotrichaceae bacterium]|nr:restriction endonuclease subunit S [Erysipelotrichaceae bacterium]